MRSIFLAGILALFSVICRADELSQSSQVEMIEIKPTAKSLLFGHSLSPTTETLTKGVWTLGTTVAGYGITDQLLVGTSTWMFYDYNSPNLVLRHRWSLGNSFFDEFAAQLLYLKSSNFYPNFYRMEVGMMWLTWRKKVNPNYTFYLAANGMYFWDETLPFSLRRNPGHDRADQYSLTTLHVLSFTEYLGLSLELGVLGLDYTKPLFHNGYSFFYKNNTWVAQVGISISASPYNLERLFSQSQDTATNNHDYYDYSIHPELQIQYFF